MARLSAEMTPKELFDSYVPEMISSRLGSVKFGSIRDSVQIHVPEAGHWTARIENGRPVVKPGKADDAYVTMVVSGDVIRMGLERASGESDTIDSIEVSGPAQQLAEAITQEFIDTLRAQINGTVRFAITSGSGTEQSIYIGFNGINTESPTCTLSTSENELIEIAEKGQSPQEAFMAGKVRLDGDMSILMGLVATAVPLIDTGMGILKGFMKNRKS